MPNHKDFISILRSKTDNMMKLLSHTNPNRPSTDTLNMTPLLKQLLIQHDSCFTLQNIPIIINNWHNSKESNYV